MLKQVSRLRVVFEKKGPFKLGELVKGKIILIPEKDVNLKSLGYKINLEIRGLIEFEDYHLSKKNIVEDQTLYKDKEYIYHFEFIYNKYETYKGLNIEILVKVVAFANFLPLIPSESFLDKINVFKSDINNWEDKKYLNFISNAYQYKIITKELELKPHSFSRPYFYSVWIFMMLGFVTSFLGLWDTYKYYLLIAFALGLILILSYYLLTKSIAGKINIQFEEIQDGKFKVKATSSNKWKQVSMISMNYRIIEEVTDNRGTTPYKVKLFKFNSKPQIFKRPNNLVESLFSFPIDEPQTIKFQDVRIYWFLEMEFTSIFGIKFTHGNEFITKKVKR